MRITGTLTAADEGTRTLTYRLLPYGQEGRTSAGRVTAASGALSWRTDVSTMTANIAHDRERPAARFADINDTADGLYATLTAFSTPAGDELLAEVREGARTGISVEVDDVVIRDGRLLAGELTGAGFTTTPAFPDAQLVASDTGEAYADTEDVSRETVEESPSDDDTGDAPEEGADVPTENSTETGGQLAASAPYGLNATGRRLETPRTVDEAARVMATAYNDRTAVPRLMAALDDITEPNAESAERDTWLSEVWAKRTHRQRFTSMFAQQALTGLRAVGWRFQYNGTTERDEVPDVGAYTALTEPASEPVIAEAVEVVASRFAGANRVDRANFDFSHPEFWAGYWREMANNVSRFVDNAALEHMLTPANYVAVAATDTPTGNNPYKTLSAIVDGIVAVEDRSIPTHAIVPFTSWREILLLPESDRFAYLSVALGIDPEDARVEQFTIVPSTHPTIAAGAVLVTSREAHTQYGERTVRAETVNIADGSVSVGLFGYNAFLTGDPRSHALVTIDTDV